MHAYYGRWLEQHGRSTEAVAQLQTAITLDPPRLLQHELLIEALRASATLARRGERRRIPWLSRRTTAVALQMLLRRQSNRRQSPEPGQLFHAAHLRLSSMESVQADD
jgi:hypothetical protein